jgi:hypothetical protein
MSKVSTIVPNLIQGISQQADVTRFKGQCDDQLNFLSDPITGLRKRPGFKLIKTLFDNFQTEDDDLFYFFKRNDNEQYLLTITHSGLIRVDNVVTGERCILNGANSITAPDYLTSFRPRRDIQPLTVADTTYLVNNVVTVEADAETTLGASEEAIVVVNQGDYKTRYRIDLTGNFTPVAGETASIFNATYNASDPNLSTTLLANDDGQSFRLSNTLHVNQSGSNYEEGFVSITTSSNGDIITHPTFDINVGDPGTVNAGQITGVQVITPGKFAKIPGSVTNVTTQFKLQNIDIVERNESVPNSGSSGAIVRRSIIDFYFTATGGNAQTWYDNVSEGQSVNITLDSDYSFNYNTRAYSTFGDSTWNDVQWDSGDTVTAVVLSDGSVKYRLILNERKRHWNSYDTYGQKYDNWDNFRGPWQQQVWDGVFNSNDTVMEAVVPIQQFTNPTVSFTVSSPTQTSGTSRLEAEHITNGAQGATATGEDGTNARRGRINTDVIAKELKAKLQTAQTNSQNTHAFNLFQEDNLVVITPSSSIINYEIRVTDGLNNQALTLLYKEVDSINDLPTFCKNGFRLKVNGDPQVNEDDYYVQFKTLDGSIMGRGNWEEVAGFGINKKFKATTMPLQLFNIARNTFILGTPDGSTLTYGDYSHTFEEYSARVAGDDNSNPFASFLGNKIKSLFFFKNRLGFITKDAVSLSEIGQPLNFFRNTVTALLDSSPIDVTITSGQLNNLSSAVAFQETLIVFADDGQFSLKGGQTLTAQNVSVTPATQFDLDPGVKPITLGAYIYFPFNRIKNTGIREYQINPNTDAYDATDITTQVPTLIPSDLISMTGSDTAETIAFTTLANNGAFTLYRYYYSGNKKVLGAWSRHTIDGDVDIRQLQFIEDSLYAVVSKGQKAWIVQLDLNTSVSSGYSLALDFLYVKQGQTDSNGNEIAVTSCNVGSDYPVGVAPVAYKEDGSKFTNQSFSGTTITLGESYEGNVYYGVPIQSEYRFSKQIFKVPVQGSNSSASESANNLLRKLHLFVDNCGYFRVQVIEAGKPECYVDFGDPNTLYTNDETSKSLPLFGQAKNVDISLYNDSAYESRFQSAEFESFIKTTSKPFNP